MDHLDEAKTHTIQGLSRISHFWGFSKGMGAIFGVLYLSPGPLSLDDLVRQVGITKGAVSTNVRHLERLGLVHKHLVIGERKDFYIAETDFWKIVRNILREREQSEFDRAINTVSDSLALVRDAHAASGDPELASFYQQRLQALSDFFKALDNLVATVLALDNLRSGTLDALLGKNKD